MKLKHHTLLLTVGPSNCGKSTFCRRLAERFGRDGAQVAHLESDRFRRQLLGANLDRHDPRMLQVSEQAFGLLKSHLKAETSYPVSKRLVMVDTTGLSEEFREEMQALAKVQNYDIWLVVFDFKNKDDYFRDLSGSQSKKIIFDHLDRLRTEVLPRLGKSKYDEVLRIKSIDSIPEVVNTIELGPGWLLPEVGPLGTRETLVIGDVHGCFDELQDLLIARGFTIQDGIVSGRDNTDIVLAGDLVDKGPKSKEVLNFVLQNPRIYVVMGNHESFCYRYLIEKEEKSLKLEEKILQGYFTFIGQYRDDPEAIQMLDRVVRRALPYYVTDLLIVTHAPCDREFLGHLDSTSLKAQRNIRYPRRQDFADLEAYRVGLEAHFGFLKQQAVRNQPLHIFGHIALADRILMKNKIGIDTGCVHGGRLSSVTVSAEGRLFWESVPCRVPGGYRPEELVSIFQKPKGPQKGLLADLPPELVHKAQKCAENKIQYISGTMAPADRDREAGTLESFDTALAYYQSKGVMELVMQPKWMGSRCQIYLNVQDLQKSYGVSRNGYRIKADLTEVFSDLIHSVLPVGMLPSTEWVILDGELLPWSALGKGLIDRAFRPVAAGLPLELSFLEQHGFEEQYGRLLAQARTELAPVRSSVPREQLLEKFGQANATRMEAVLDFDREWEPVADQRKGAVTYAKQVELYGGEGPVKFQPFDVLKVINRDGTEKVRLGGLTSTPSTQSRYRFVSLARQAFISWAEPESIEIARLRHQKWIASGLEGVVIKPNVLTPGIAPYLKVRNPDYLTLIYGPDYLKPSKYRKLLEKKNVRKKREISILEAELGEKMLAIPYGPISPDNLEYVQLAAHIWADVERDKQLDPCL